MKRVIGPEDLHRLADEVGPDWRLLIYLGGVMGLRIGEALGLRWVDVDLAEPHDHRKPDGQRGRRPCDHRRAQDPIQPPNSGLPLQRSSTSSSPIGDSDRGENPDGLVFHDSIGGPVRASNLRYRVLDPAVRAVGLDGLTFHGLRHSAATEWVASGIDARTVQHRLGHTDPGLVLRLYAHSSTDADRRAAGVVGELYWPTTGE